MSVYHYHLEVYDARKQNEKSATATTGHRRQGGVSWVFEFESDDEASQSNAEAAFLAAFEAAKASAPIPHIRRLSADLKAALDVSATTGADSGATNGAWSERVGKSVFGYFIGVSTTSFQGAVTNGTDHNVA
jgi:hypothetical protein